MALEPDVSLVRSHDNVYVSFSKVLADDDAFTNKLIGKTMESFGCQMPSSRASYANVTNNRLLPYLCSLLELPANESDIGLAIDKQESIMLYSRDRELIKESPYAREILQSCKDKNATILISYSSSNPYIPLAQAEVAGYGANVKFVDMEVERYIARQGGGVLISWLDECGFFTKEIS